MRSKHRAEHDDAKLSGADVYRHQCTKLRRGARRTIVYYDANTAACRNERYPTRVGNGGVDDIDASARSKDPLHRASD